MRIKRKREEKARFLQTEWQRRKHEEERRQREDEKRKRSALSVQQRLIAVGARRRPTSFIASALVAALAHRTLLLHRMLR